MRKWLILYVLMIIFDSLLAQDYHTQSKKAIRMFELALELYQNQDLENAHQELYKSLRLDPDFGEANVLLAEIALSQKRLDDAALHYKKAVDKYPDDFPRVHLFLAKVLIQSGRYAEACEYLDSFKKYPVSGRYSDQLNAATQTAGFALDAIQNADSITIVRLAATINTRADEYSPALTLDGRTLLFSRAVGESFRQEDFFYSQLNKEGNWTPARRLPPPLNTTDNEGSGSLSANGSQLFFSACNRPDGYGRCDLYLSEFENSGWSVPVNLGNVLNSSAWDSQPSISPDGRHLYFVSNRSGGKGGMDIYYSVKNENDSWSKPQNMGDSINTTGNEMYPFIHADGHSFYFSSDGRLGMGGLDIFKAELSQNTICQSVVNMGFPINTHNDETGLVFNAKGNQAFLAKGDSGNLDIYAYTIPPELRPEPVFAWNGQVIDVKTNKPLKARILLTGLEENQRFYDTHSTTDGLFTLGITRQSGFALHARVTGYALYSKNINKETVADKNFILVEMIPLEQGTRFVLNNLFFDTDSYTIQEQSKPELEALYAFVLSSDYKIELAGHTDSRGDEAYNLKLSTQRARAVYDYLIEKGISDKLLVYKGYGESEPVDDNNSETGRQKNRRTEVRILEKLK